MRSSWLSPRLLLCRWLTTQTCASDCRLKGCEQDVEIWQRVLSVRSLVLTPSQDKDMWIKFANLCRKSDRLGLAEKTLNSLLGPQDASAGDGVRLSPPDGVPLHD